MTKSYPSFKTEFSAPFLWNLLWFLKVCFFGSSEFFGISLVFSFVIHNFLPYTLFIFSTCLISPNKIWISYFTLYPQRADFPQMVGWMNPIHWSDKKVVTEPCHCQVFRAIAFSCMACPLPKASWPGKWVGPEIQLTSPLLSHQTMYQAGAGLHLPVKRVLVLCMKVLSAG